MRLAPVRIREIVEDFGIPYDEALRMTIRWRDRGYPLVTFGPHGERSPNEWSVDRSEYEALKRGEITAHALKD